MVDVPLREHLEALLAAHERYVATVAELRQAHVGDRLADLARRLDESAHDRERIRNSLSTFVPRAEYDRAQGQTLNRVGALERSNARLLGGVGVIAVLLTVLGVALRYLVG